MKPKLKQRYPKTETLASSSTWRGAAEAHHGTAAGGHSQELFLRATYARQYKLSKAPCKETTFSHFSAFKGDCLGVLGLLMSGSLGHSHAAALMR